MKAKDSALLHVVLQHVPYNLITLLCNTEASLFDIGNMQHAVPIVSMKAHKFKPAMLEMLAKHMPISPYLNKTKKLGYALGHILMFWDSRVATKVLQHFTDRGEPIIPIHESFLCRKQVAEEMIKVMYQALQEVVDEHIRKGYVMPYAADEIVRIKKSSHPAWLSKDIELPTSMVMRRLSFEDVHNPGKEYVIYTTLLDEAIEKADIVLKYFTRWDIEISIREIKTLMDINIVRSKKSGMVKKDI